ncbi:MAG TPA: tetratricopeptide repeat protein, partial [Pyrinomonadaceae bacterium]|nr:tetratricopeptide repeat protein [Pyrinomonadaceae bacterium]
MSQRFYLSLLAVGFACVVALVPVSTRVAAGTGGATVAASVPSASAAGEAERALAEGTALLRRNRADQALPLVESALKLFTQANNQSGLAAAHAALGDIYLRHGQYTTALEHFQPAAEIFRTGRETANAALMFAKLGETYYLAGDEQAARAAFARIGEGEKRDGGAAGIGLNTGANTSGGNRNNSGAVGGAPGMLTFASLSTLLPASCLSATPNDVSPTESVASNLAGRIAPGGNAPNNPLNNPAAGNSSANPSVNPSNTRPTNPSGSSSGTSTG